MKAEKDTVVSFQYELSDGAGSAEKSRVGKQTALTLLGRGQVIPGLEQALLDHQAGDCFEVDVQPEQGYGLREEGRIQRVPKKYFRDASRLKPGMLTGLRLREGGQRAVTIHKVGMSTMDVDLNHPLAGKTLHFNVEVLDVREATPEELAHGHAHGPDAHKQEQ